MGRRLHECLPWHESTVYKTECTVTKYSSCYWVMRSLPENVKSQRLRGKKRVFLCLFQLWKRNMWDICTGELLSNRLITQEQILVKVHLTPYWKFKPNWRSSIYLSFQVLKTRVVYVYSKNFCTMFWIWNTALYFSSVAKDSTVAHFLWGTKTHLLILWHHVF